MKLRYYIIILFTLIIASCDKELEVNGGVPDFEVTTDKSIYKVNEVIDFKFKGNPGIISFYSGEILGDYAFREGRILPPGDIKISFTSNLANGSQQNQLSVMISTDFNGVYDLENIKAATWTDITNRFTLATSSSFTNSGTVDISDLRVGEKPIYVLYRYIYDPAKTGAARTWGIRGFNVTSTTLLGTTTIADQSAAGFSIYSNAAKEMGRSYITTSGTLTLYLRGNATNPTANYLEDWAVSQPIDVGSIDLGPDRPLAIKGNSDPRIDSYQHAYSLPGVYKTIFVASNASISEIKSVIRETEITVVP